MRLFANKLIVNTIVQIAGRLAGAVLVFVATLILASKLGSDEFGVYTHTVSLLTLFYSMTDLGMNTVFLHLMRHTTLSRFSPFLGLRVSLGVLLMALAIAVGRLGVFGPLAIGWVSLIVGAFSIISYAIFLTTGVIFQWIRRLDLQVASQTVGNLIG
ncbi:MAG: hypothetical protein AAB874_04915, partial [Patescibacteria group bacterium]